MLIRRSRPNLMASFMRFLLARSVLASWGRQVFWQLPEPLRYMLRSCVSSRPSPPRRLASPSDLSPRAREIYARLHVSLEGTKKEEV